LGRLLTQVNVRMKIIIIIILKLDRVDLGPDLSHDSGWPLTRVNIRIKIIIIILKPNSKIDWVKPKSLVRLTIDPN